MPAGGRTRADGHLNHHQLTAAARATGLLLQITVTRKKMKNEHEGERKDGVPGGGLPVCVSCR